MSKRPELSSRLGTGARQDGVKPDWTDQRRGLCGCSICVELRSWWWQALWTAAIVIANDVEVKLAISALEWIKDKPLWRADDVAKECLKKLGVSQ